jgi:hypothetical protein
MAAEAQLTKIEFVAVSIAIVAITATVTEYYDITHCNSKP